MKDETQEFAPQETLPIGGPYAGPYNELLYGQCAELHPLNSYGRCQKLNEAYHASKYRKEEDVQSDSGSGDNGDAGESVSVPGKAEH